VWAPSMGAGAIGWAGAWLSLLCAMRVSLPASCAFVPGFVSLIKPSKVDVLKRWSGADVVRMHMLQKHGNATVSAARMASSQRCATRLCGKTPWLRRHSGDLGCFGPGRQLGQGGVAMNVHDDAQDFAPMEASAGVPPDGSAELAAPFADTGSLVCEQFPSERYREVNEFYREQGYKAVCRPTDILWVLRDHPNNKLMGAVRLTPQRYKPLGDVLFLRSLCIAKRLRRRGLGSRLTRAATADNAALPRYCFALQELIPLYVGAGWEHTQPADVPPTIRARFEAVVQQSARKHKSVAIMSHGVLPSPAQASAREQPSTAHSAPPLTTHIVLLQHINEVRRPTSTAAVLEEVCGSTSFVRLERWVWRGKGDNDKIGALLDSSPRPCVLVWAETPRSASSGAGEGGWSRRSDEAREDRCHIILDGTWQEARTLYRRSGGWGLGVGGWGL
jgi:hypothetical protein